MNKDYEEIKVLAKFTQFKGLKWVFIDIWRYIFSAFKDYKQEIFKVILPFEAKCFNAEQIYRVTFILSKDKEGQVLLRLYNIKIELLDKESLRAD